MLLANDMGMKRGDDWSMTNKPRQRRVVAAANQPKVQDHDEPLYLGEWLSAIGMSAAKLRAATGLNEGYISELKNGGKANPSNKTLRKIADAMDIKWQWLYEPPPKASTIADASKYGSSVIDRLSKAGRKN